MLYRFFSDYLFVASRIFADFYRIGSLAIFHFIYALRCHWYIYIAHPITQPATGAIKVRGKNRRLIAVNLFITPGITIDFLCVSAFYPICATLLGDINVIRTRGLSVWPETVKNSVRVAPGQSVVTTTLCFLSSWCNASPKRRT